MCCCRRSGVLQLLTNKRLKYDFTTTAQQPATVRCSRCCFNQFLQGKTWSCTVGASSSWHRYTRRVFFPSLPQLACCVFTFTVKEIHPSSPLNFENVNHQRRRHFFVPVWQGNLCTTRVFFLGLFITSHNVSKYKTGLCFTFSFWLMWKKVLL